MVGELMPEAKQTNWLPYAVIAVLGYLVWHNSTLPPNPNPTPSPVTIEKATGSVLSAMKAANAKAFNDAADRVESKEITTDKQLFEFVQPVTKSARETANKPFDVALDLQLPRNEDGTFSGKEAEVVKLLRRIAKAW